MNGSEGKEHAKTRSEEELLGKMFRKTRLEPSEGHNGTSKKSSRHEREGEIPFMSVCATLVQGCQYEENSPKLVRELLNLHRIEQNTKARRRLERWVTRLIVWYLFTVLLLVLLYALGPDGYLFCFRIGLEISNVVMVTILSTTTVNVIGLAIILVRGLFPSGKRNLDSISKEE